VSGPDAPSDAAGTSGTIAITDSAPVGVTPGDYLLTATVTSSAATRVTFAQRVDGSTAWDRVGEFDLAGPSTPASFTMIVRLTSPADALRATATGSISSAALTLTPVAPDTVHFLVRGTQVVDPANAAASWHGVNSGQFCCAASDAPDAAATKLRYLDDIRNQTRASVVRVPISEFYWLPFFTASYDPAYRQQVIDYVDHVTSLGMVAIVDLHFCGQDDPAFTWSNDGAVKQDWLVMPDAPSLDFWRDAAGVASWKNNPLVVFELYNEPKINDAALWRDGGMVSAPRRGGGTATWLAPGHQQLHDVIRAEGALNPILVEGTGWGGDLVAPLAHPLDGWNIIYVAHAYQSAAESQNAPGTYPAHLDTAVAPAHVAPYSEAILLDEFGSPLRPNGLGLLDHGTDYERSVIGWADQHGLGWQAWGWYLDSWDGFGLLTSFDPLGFNAKGQVVVDSMP
jgi:hypothetical protein